jgi:ATP-dependent DNA helicase RecG
VEAASATAEYQRLTRVFSDLRVGLLHGQLPPRDKEAVMDSFRRGELDLLVSTTVIEVGIDVPNATVMLIEDADRFGLSQLHQLRGRVGRGGHPGHCLLIADPATDEGRARIEAMVATNDGFRLAEEDLRIRGQGTVFGTRQSGMADLRLADILEDFELLVAARREAFALVDVDPELDDHPDLAEEVRVMLGEAVEWLFVS